LGNHSTNSRGAITTGQGGHRQWGRRLFLDEVKGEPLVHVRCLLDLETPLLATSLPHRLHSSRKFMLQIDNPRIQLSLLKGTVDVL
jgi:hypothetical protein